MQYRQPHHYLYIIGTISLLTLYGYVNPALAEPAQSEADYFSTDLPVVLSATRLKQAPADVPVAISIIDRQMIEASGFTEIPDLLRLVPGFIVDYDSGNVQVVGYHFLPDVYVRQQQVLIDGRSVYTPMFGGVPWTDLPITIDDIDRIEVIRGPNAATYGSNSFLGVINIITRHAALDKGTAIKTNIGTHQQHEVFVRNGGNHGELDYKVTAAYRSDDGFDNRYDGKIVRMINSRFDYQVNPHNDISFQAGYNEGPRQKDDVIEQDTPNYSRRLFSQFQQVRWENKISTDDEFHVQLYHNLIQDNNIYDSIKYALTRDETYSADRYDLEAQYNNKPSAELRYAIGGSYRLDRVVGPLFFNTQSPQQSYFRRIFGEAEYRLLDNTSVNTGLMIENNDTSGTSYSPRVAINSKLNPENTVRFSISKATRVPVMFEKQPDYYIAAYNYQLYLNTDTVKNETITAYDLGLIGGDNTRQWQYDIRLFIENIKGLIGINSIPNYNGPNLSAYYFDNFYNLSIRGGEFQFDWRPTQSMRIHGGYSRISINSHVLNNADIEDVNSLSAPLNAYNMLFMYAIDKHLDSSVGVYYRDPMKPIVKKFVDPAVTSQNTRLDFRLSYHNKFAGFSHTLAFVAQNLLNDKYYIRVNNIIDRRGYISYKIEF